MNYAAGVGDLNPAYLDDARPGGIVAPPMLAAALTWQVTRRYPDFLEGDPFPRAWLGYGVHYREILEWHRPMVPGDILTIRGKVAAVLPHGSGTYLGIQYQAEDLQGAAVFSEHFGWVYRGIACADRGRGGHELPPSPDPPAQSSPLWTERIAVSPGFAHVYDGCADIHNPIHTSRDFARAVGLPEPILHGTATLALAVRELVNREAGGDPRRLRSLDCRFTAMVLLGGAVEVQLLGRNEAPSAIALFFQVLNSRGERAISRGSVLLSVQ
jgi:acyl dehydratase